MLAFASHKKSVFHNCLTLDVVIFLHLMKYKEVSYFGDVAFSQGTEVFELVVESVFILIF